MNIELDINDAWIERVVVLWAKDTLDMTKKCNSKHPDNVKYNKKLVKALKLVLNYMGESDA
jgi:hypothetical protein